MEQYKQQPTSLAVSDLQLMVAFYMRHGLDLTNHMQPREGGGFLITYTGVGPVSDRLLIAKGTTLSAEFDANNSLVSQRITTLYLGDKEETNEPD